VLSDDRPPSRRAAYALCVDADGRLLLARCAAGEPEPGAWTLPGGGVDWGEHPDDAVVRELEEETGIGIVYRMASWTGTARACGWFGRDEVTGLELVDLARFGVGLVGPDLLR
jgi:8-oxo-dGTP pyrophosphatase MutT (NUDIX family)